MIKPVVSMVSLKYFSIEYKFVDEFDEFQVGKIIGRTILALEQKMPFVVTCEYNDFYDKIMVGIDKDFVDPENNILIPVCQTGLFHQFMAFKAGMASVKVFRLDENKKRIETIFKNKNYKSKKGQPYLLDYLDLFD